LWTDVRTDIRPDVPTDGRTFPPLMLLGRLLRVDLERLLNGCSSSSTTMLPGGDKNCSAILIQNKCVNRQMERQTHAAYTVLCTALHCKHRSNTVTLGIATKCTIISKYSNLPISKPSVDIFNFVPCFTFCDTPTNTMQHQTNLLMYMQYYTQYNVPQKTTHLTFYHNFGKCKVFCKPIQKILSLSESKGNST